MANNLDERALDLSIGQRLAWEDEPCEGVTLKRADPDVTQAYLRMAGRPGQTAEDLLVQEGYLVNGTLTRGGTLLFAKDPAQFIPCARVHLARFKEFERDGGKQRICVKDLLLDGPLPKLMVLVEDSVLDLTDEVMFFDTDGGFKKVRDYPRHAWVDGLMGAIMHRSYRSDSYIHITILEDRLQILSPGTPDIPLDTAARDPERSQRNPRLTRGMMQMGYSMEQVATTTSVQDQVTTLVRPKLKEKDVLDGRSVQFTVKSNIEAWNQLLEENMVDGRMLLSPIYAL